MMEREILIARGENLTMMIKNRKLFYQSLDAHCSEIQDFVLKVDFWNIGIELGELSLGTFKLNFKSVDMLELGEVSFGILKLSWVM